MEWKTKCSNEGCKKTVVDAVMKTARRCSDGGCSDK